MNKYVAGAAVAVTGGVVFGLIGTGIPTIAQASDSDDDPTAYKRKDDMSATLETVDEEDDDDTMAGLNRAAMDVSRDATSVSKTTRGTGSSRSRRDHTNSRYSPLSRDRDGSRGDKTKDRTYDGKGGLKRDWSRNHTNDRSRNDSRHGARA